MSTRTFAGGVVVEEWDDTTRTYRHADDGSRPYTEAEAADLDRAALVVDVQSKRQRLLDALAVALAVDLAYLALTPLERTAQANAQVVALTRQTVGVIRLATGLLTE